MNSLDEIKHYIIQNFKLEDLIREDTDIKKSGSRLSACCPFHEENTPSFYIFSDHYHCFGCKAHGDVINYVREKKGLGFIEAIEYLGEKLGIDTSPVRKNKRDRVSWEKKSRQVSAYNLAQKFFTHHLFTSFGKPALEYILSRGYTLDQVKEYGFGFALNSPSALSKELKSKGYRPEELEEYSLSNVHQNETYDFFRGRLMIPIRDISGKLIAFAGRTLTNSPQKYKNSRYDKKSFLFGLDQAHKAIKKSGRAIVVEGYLDAIRLWSLGLTETVACQGTALTLEHMKKLKGLAKDVFILFDGDSAGKKSALKIISDSQQISGVSFYFSELPEGEDPDSFTQKNGPGALEELLRKSPPLIEFVISERFRETPEQRTPELLRNEILPWLRATQDRLQQAYFMKKISELSGLNENLLRAEMAKEPRSFPQKSKVVPQEQPQAKPVQSEKPFLLPPYLKDLIGHLYFINPSENFNFEEVKIFYMKKLELPEPWNTFFRELLSEIKQKKSSCSEKDIHLWISSQSPEIIQFLNHIARSKEAFKCSHRDQLIHQLILIHEKKLIKKKINTLKLTIQKSALKPRESYDVRILTEINELYKQLMTLPEALA